MDEIVILEGFYHEQGKVHAPRDVALEDGVAHVLAPQWQPLALALFQRPLGTRQLWPASGQVLLGLSKHAGMLRTWSSM